MSVGKREIAESFERHVNRYGYAKTTLDEVARELRISKKTIYVHFDGKRDIYAYIVEGLARREKAKLAAAIATLPTYAARMEGVVRSVLQMGRAHVEETSREEWLAEYEIAADAFRKAHGDLIRELYEAGVQAGEFAPGDATLVQKMIAVMITEYLVILNEDPAYDRDEELLERMRRFVG